MPQKKEYESSSDRQKAYRERKRQELEEQLAEQEAAAPRPAGPVDDEQAERNRWGYSDSELRSKLERDAAAQRMLGRETTMPSEEVYVQQCVELARLHHKQTSSEARDSSDLLDTGLESRLARAEAYAHWRYKSFLAGEVVSL